MGHRHRIGISGATGNRGICARLKLMVGPRRTGAVDVQLVSVD